MKPIAWVITWQALADAPAGSRRFTVRSEARGFLMMRRALGFTADIHPEFNH